MEAKFNQIFKIYAFSIHNVEVQLGQLATTITIRPQGNLPSNTETNLREQLKSITLRSRKEINIQVKGFKDDTIKEDQVSVEIEKEIIIGKEVSKQRTQEESKIKRKDTKEVTLSFYAPKVPFPQRLKKAQDNQQFAKFLEIFKNLQINIPLPEALAQMPLYTKYLKDLITNKRN